uniref:Integrin, alpha M (complement component 3 receptor 3 subunit) n=1 Tax=Scophthalmus maximus TaxID=52904 RepID=A0A8D3C6G1_SCOMX
MITASVLLSVLKTALCFNIDPVAWKSWSNDAAGFGYQVVQRPSDVLVSAPLAQYSQNRRGEIYKCSGTIKSCQKMQIQVPEFAVNMSLGLTMTSDPVTQSTMACGPTIPKDCKSITMYNGACFQTSRSDIFQSVVPLCRTEADIAFLLDGSGSVIKRDFTIMKNFVKKMVRPFVGKDTQFAVVQFSRLTKVHYYFNNFFSSGRWESNIDGIIQEEETTYTASAIEYVVQNVFTSARGSRPNVKKILIVITDGISHDRNRLPNAADLAKRKQIVRFAIGVGNAFHNYDAKQELNQIASSPSEKHVFQVESFNALEAIRKNLEEKIFSIEGYSMAVATTPQGTLTIVGAPRYKHIGAVLTVRADRIHKIIDPFLWHFQTGEYFGAEVCAMDVNGDSYTDLILISAPMYKETDSEGRVYCHELIHSFPMQTLTLLRDASDNGRFGSSLAVLPDLNTDRLREVAVGAPLENDGQGCIYIFHGEGGGRISASYSQRIAGAEVQSGLKLFGVSISQLSFDHSGDNLPDLAVGSNGTVVLLRSKPIVMVDATVSFSPNQIPTQNIVCSVPLENMAEICFTMKAPSSVHTARIDYTLILDATRKVPNNRAYISDKQRETTGSIDIQLGRQQCRKVKFSIEVSCQEMFYNRIKNHIFKKTLNPIQPSQPQQKLGFEINCGTDNKCVDNLKVDFNFSRSSEVQVGIDELLNVTVSVQNSEENSYNSQVILTYPAGLSYRKFTSLQGRIECSSLDSEDGLLRGKTLCAINKPIFKSNMEVFILLFAQFISLLSFSGNQDHSSSSEFYKRKLIDVKYSIFITIERFVVCLFCVRQRKNDIILKALNFSVVIKVPVKLGDKDIWADLSSLQIPNCQQLDTDERVNVTDFVSLIQKNKVVDCNVASCRVFKCSRFMGRLESKTYKISANLSSGWIEQIGLPSAKFLLTSSASLEYDTNQYIFFSLEFDPHVACTTAQIETVIEVYPEPDFTKEIVGGSLGGLALLALLTAGLYKAGFFKSKYNEMINEAGGGADPGADGDAATPEQLT